MSGLYVAKSGFASNIDGVLVRVAAGDIAEEGHPVLERSPDSFRPLEVKFPTGAGDLPEGVEDIGGGWFKLADGRKVRGHKALSAALASTSA